MRYLTYALGFVAAVAVPLVLPMMGCRSGPALEAPGVTTAPAVIGGVSVPAGTFLTIGIGAANRDPAEFANPDRFDISRQPNRHLAFGSGAHVCAGLNIARLEGRIGIARLLARFPNYRLRAAPIRGGRARFRGFLSLPAEIG